MARAIRLLLVAPLPPPTGGITQWTRMLVKHLSQCGRVHVSVINTAPRWRHFHEIRSAKRLVVGALQFVRDVLRLIIRISDRPDVIHMTTSGGIGFLRDLGFLSLARITGSTTVYHLRFGRLPTLALARTWEWRLAHIALRLANTVITLDRRTEDVVQNVKKTGLVQVLPNFVSLEGISIAKREVAPKQFVLFVGWVIPSKGIEDLLVAWKGLATVGWELVVLGPIAAHYQASLLRRFEGLNVRYLGVATHGETLSWITAADLVTLPSHTEGFPNAIAEAMMLGKPVVATSVGAIPEMLGDGCGLLVQPNSPTDLRDALERVINDAALRDKLGCAARQRALQQYSPDAVIQRLIAIWEESARPRRNLRGP